MISKNLLMKTNLKNIYLFITIILTLNSCNMNDYSDLKDGIYANIETSKGDILVKLFYEKTPLTVSNFIALSEGNHPAVSDEFSGKPYYDGIKFHRVIENFMIQGGDPTGSGSGGPGFQFNDEIVEELKHDSAGVLSMANAGPGTNGSQFFITHIETPWLDGKHTVFGKVNTGQDVVDAIVQDDIIEKVKIIRIGSDAENFNAPKVFDEFVTKQSEAELLKIEEEKQILAKLTQGMKETNSGLKYNISKKGTGDNAKPNDLLSVHYSLKLLDGSEIDSSFTRGEPIQFTCGVGQVIKGWDEAMQLLNKGSKATLVIPSELGYGSTGAGNGVIPPNSTLIFEVELIEIN